MTGGRLFLGYLTARLCPIYPPGIVALRQTQSKFRQPTTADVATAKVQTELENPTTCMRLSTATGWRCCPCPAHQKQSPPCSPTDGEAGGLWRCGLSLCCVRGCNPPSDQDAVISPFTSLLAAAVCAWAACCAAITWAPTWAAWAKCWLTRRRSSSIWASA